MISSKGVCYNLWNLIEKKSCIWIFVFFGAFFMAFEMFEIKEQSVRWVDLGSIALNPAHH